MNSDKATIKGIYDKKSVAEQYIHTRFSRPLGAVQHRIQVATVNEAIRQHEARSILEIACGPARLTAEITGFNNGIAIDSSQQMLSIAKARVPETLKWRFLIADAFTFQIDQKFHLIYSFRFIRHLTLTDRKRIYTTIRNLLDHQAIFIFDAVHYDKPTFIKSYETRGDIQLYDKIYQSKLELTTELSEVGFEIIEYRNLIRHFYLQAIISRVTHLLSLNNVGEKVISVLDNLKYGRPLEWIVICRKT